MAHTRRTIPSLFAASLLILTLVLTPHAGAATAATPASSSSPALSSLVAPLRAASASTSRSRWLSASYTQGSSNGPAVSPAVVPGVTVTVNVPPTLGAGAIPVTFTGTITNSTANTYNNARVDFVITETNNITSGQIDLEYDAGGGNFQRIPLSDSNASGNNNTIMGFFGPRNGFTLPAGAVNTTVFRVSTTGNVPSSTLTVRTNLDRVDPSGNGVVLATLATTSGAVSINKPVIALNLPANLGAGAVPVTFTGTITNATPVSFTNVRVDFAITGTSAITSGQITLEYDAGGGNFQRIPLTDSNAGGNNNTITGFFGPAGGFTLPAGAVNTTVFRVSIAGARRPAR